MKRANMDKMTSGHPEGKSVWSAQFRPYPVRLMAQHSTPHFHNSNGLPRIEIGAKEFLCVGAIPPFDHPHEFLDMGSDNEVVCPYCSTLYVFNPALPKGSANPESAVYSIEHA